MVRGFDREERESQSNIDPRVKMNAVEIYHVIFMKKS